MRIISIIIALFVIAAPAKADDATLADVNKNIRSCLALSEAQLASDRRVYQKCIDFIFAVDLAILEVVTYRNSWGNPKMKEFACKRAAYGLYRKVIQFEGIYGTVPYDSDRIQELQTQCERGY